MTNIPNTKIPISVAVPFDLLTQVGSIVKRLGISRSDYVVQALRERVQKDKSDED